MDLSLTSLRARTAAPRRNLRRALLLMATALGLLAGTSMAAAQGFIVKLEATPDSAVQARRLAGGNALFKAQARSLGNHWYLLSTVKALPAAQTSALAARLRGARHVQHVLPNTRESLTAVPNDTLYATEQWWLASAGATEAAVPGLPAAWDRSTGHPVSGAAPVVAVLDSGYTPHPELDPHWVLPGHDFVSQTAYSNDGNGADNDALDPGDRLTAAEAAADPTLWDGCEVRERSSWHGTMMAGQIGATSNNSAGVAAINWNGRILPVRVAGKCGAAVADVVGGLRWAAGLDVSGVARNLQPAKVIVIGVAGFEPCDLNHPNPAVAAAARLYTDTLAEVRARGALVVAAAGNQRSIVGRPASCTGAFAVTSLNRQGFKANYANYGAQVALATVGGDAARGATCDTQLADSGLVTTSNEGGGPIGAFGYAAGSGTSFAAPLVAGVASLMWASNPALTVAQIEAGLRASARPHVKVPILQACSSAGNFGRCQCSTSTCGAGILDADQALLYAAAPATYAPPSRLAPELDSAAIRQCAVALGLPLPEPDAPAPEPAPSAPASSGGGGAIDPSGVFLMLLLLSVLALALQRRQG
ncbi:MAG: S8 family serine peptidase [Rhodoferax sp.]|nr:S8 family serine peptidase [Rhodoferax sp.]MDP3653810.1 S8 family serine peptidase [Rhodoferax sp.]